METLGKEIEKDGENRTLRSCALIFSLTVLLAINVSGDTISTENATPAANATSNNDTTRLRQVWNGTAWVNASSPEDDSAAIAEEQKKADHQTFMTYLYMTIGFLAILAIAWFTRGKEKKGAEMAVNTNGVKHQHSSGDKKYGGHKHRR